MKNNLGKMMGLDLYFSSLSLEDYQQLAPNIENSPTTTPLLSWDIFSDCSHKRLSAIKKAREIEAFQKFIAKFQFQNNFNQIFSTYDFEALVITNLKKEIVWVSNGFKEMTGYDKKFVLHKSPDFLQGEKTSAVTKKRIRKNILTNRNFTETIINYKKDNTPYKCELNVFPLYTEKTTHFLALEKQVR